MYLEDENKTVKHLALKINENKEKRIIKEYPITFKAPRFKHKSNQEKHIVSSTTTSLANITTFYFQHCIPLYRKIKNLPNFQAYKQNIPINIYQNMNKLLSDT